MIKRYAMHYYLDGADLKENGYGDWCKYEDVQKLEQQNQKLVELIDFVIAGGDTGCVLREKLKQIQQPDGGK